MSFSAWVAFTGFWFVFTTSPEPNAVNCLQNGLTYGFRRSLWGVAAILLQASLFLALASFGAAATLQSHPDVIYALRLLGAVILIWLGLRSLKAILAEPATQDAASPKADASAAFLFWSALAIAVFNVKSLLGYVAGGSIRAARAAARRANADHLPNSFKSDHPFLCRLDGAWGLCRPAFAHAGHRPLHPPALSLLIDDLRHPAFGHALTKRAKLRGNILGDVALPLGTEPPETSEKENARMANHTGVSLNLSKGLMQQL